MPAFGEQARGDRKPGKRVSSAAAGGNHHGAGHTVNPRSSRRFWLRPAASAALTRATRALAFTEIDGATVVIR
jgi:hypothetical protein